MYQRMLVPADEDELTRIREARQTHADLARFEKTIRGVSATWQKPSNSLPNIYPPGALPRTPQSLAAITFNHNVASATALPRPRPLSYFRDPRDPVPVPQLYVPKRRKDKRGAAVALKPLQTSASQPLQQVQVQPPQRARPTKQRQSLSAQLRQFLIDQVQGIVESYAEWRPGAATELRADLARATEQRVAACFRAWDTDESGAISRYEFAKAMAVLGFPVTREEMTQLFDELDKDRSNSIKYEELESVLSGDLRGAATAPLPAQPVGGTQASKSSKRTPVQWIESRPMAGQISDMLMGQMRQVMDAFAEWDTDGSSGISHDEFVKAMGALGLKASSKLKKLWKEFDSDGSGEISVDELRGALDPAMLGTEETALMAVPRAYDKRSLPTSKIQTEMRTRVTGTLRNAAVQMHEAFSEMAIDRVLDVFRTWDHDDGGTISRKEFAEAMVRLGVKTTKVEMSKLFNQLDPDRSGEINYRELYWAIKDQRGDAPKGAFDRVERVTGIGY